LHFHSAPFAVKHNLKKIKPQRTQRFSQSTQSIGTRLCTLCIFDSAPFAVKHKQYKKENRKERKDFRKAHKVSAPGFAPFAFSLCTLCG